MQRICALVLPSFSRSFLLFAAVSSPFALAEGEAAETVVKGEVGAALDAHFTKAAEEEGLSIVLLVGVGGEVVLAKGYGFADRARGLPLTTDSVLTIGSITKQFTGAAILKLEMEGKLSVDDPIDKYLPGVEGKAKAIRIHHLLTHTASMRSAVGDDFDETSRDEIIKLALKRRAHWAPGERHHYSNPGYSLLGAIIEIVSGMGYEAYLHQVFFEPLGMSDTGYLIPKWDQDRLAHGYRRNRDWGTLLDHPWAEDGPYWNLRANGGIMSTVWDMYAWHQALLDDRVLSDAAREKLFARHVSEGKGSTWHYGYGWAIATTERGTKLVAHNGGNDYFFADFRRYVDDGVVIIFLSNTADRMTEKHERAIRRIIFIPNASAS
jgi:CubicO group peptidase (beta-lactamase class C family)